MNLKKIELQGFKSFADKTEIVFEHDMTGVVGPNGCGKSNIIDAVRWVLGEQSPTALRCSKMSDLIFGGTKNRRSQSYCEVSIYLDNSAGQYPMLADYDEIVVTRKLDRSGDSEYLINRQNCRWRDIIDLFRDSGIGKEGYSIIGQGKIEQILAARPDVRRQIFEDAAGITKHKARRVETEKRLENARANMLQLSISLAETEAKLGPLEKEAADARKLKEIRRELKKLEISQYLFESEHSGEERERLEKRLAEITKAVTEKENELKSINERYNTARMDIANSDIYAKKLNGDITDLMVAAEKIAGDSRALGKEMESLQAEEQRLAGEISQNEIRIAEKSKLLMEKIAARGEAESELAKRDEAVSELQKAYDAIERSVEQQEKMLEASRELASGKQSKYAEVNKNRAEFELERKILYDGMGSAKAEYDDKKKLLAAAEKEGEGYRADAERVKSERAAKFSEKEKAAENLAQAESELKEVQVKLKQAEDRVKNDSFKVNVIEESIKGFLGYDNVVQDLMNDAKNDKKLAEKLLGTVGQLITVPRDFQNAIETALGANVQNIVVPNVYDANDMIDYIRNKGYGKATFCPLDTMKPSRLGREQESALSEDGVIGCAIDLVRFDRKYYNVYSAYLGKTVIVEDKPTATRVSKKYDSSFRIITLDGEVYQTNGSVSGGASKNKSRILSRETELAEAKKRLVNAEKEAALLSETAKELQEECAELSQALKIIDARLQSLDNELTAIGGKIARTESESAIYRAAIDKILSENTASGERIKELEELLTLAEKSQADIESEKMTAEDFITEAKNKYFAEKQQRDQMGRDLTSAKLRASAAKATLDNLDVEIINLKQEGRFLESNLLDLKAQAATNARRISAVKNDIDTTRFSPEDSAKLAAMKKEADSLDVHKAEMNALIGELDLRREEVNRAFNELVEKRIKEQTALDYLDVQINGLSANIEASYGYDFAAAKGYRDELLSEEVEFRYDPEKAPGEIMSLKRKIQRLGPVNELAEEQFASETERYAENKKQYEDCKSASDKLIEVINELTAEMTEKFTKSFKQININFNEVFRELFGGGFAKLELEKDMDVLEAGIIIMAEPPGKKLTTLAPLSGGERALTAIAILFAIIKLRPMPFSILDEIEAALDEGNAGLFAKYLKKFSAVTQFIVVTHRKPTMELCDVLYGITNQEMGVSKQVKVKLEDAVKAAEEDVSKGA